MWYSEKTSHDILTYTQLAVQVSTQNLCLNQESEKQQLWMKFKQLFNYFFNKSKEVKYKKYSQTDVSKDILHDLNKYVCCKKKKSYQNKVTWKCIGILQIKGIMFII